MNNEQTLAVDWVAIESIKPHPSNPRKNHQVARVADSIRSFGWRQPIVVDRDGFIVVGHGRYYAAKELGLERVPVHRADDLTPDEAVAYRIADNRAHEGAAWDMELLIPQLKELDGKDLTFDLSAVGWTNDELKDLLGPQDGLTDPDEVPPLPANPITKPGDLIILGDHRLLCGDATKREDVERVMGELKVIDFIFTDPPYGHNNNNGDLIHNREKALGKPKKKSSAARPIANDDPESAARLYTAFLGVANKVLGPGCCCCCCCCGGGPDPQFARWSLEMDEAIGFKHAVVWDKGGLGMGWHYRRNYEFILVAEKPGGKCRWYGGKDVPNLIRGIGKIIPSADQHPTEKPVALPAFFIQLHTKISHSILDPFLGSGSTLIAAEQLGRRCCGIEISPAYCDIVVRRWELFTGKTAKRP